MDEHLPPQRGAARRPQPERHGPRRPLEGADPGGLVVAPRLGRGGGGGECAAHRVPLGRGCGRPAGGGGGGVGGLAATGQPLALASRATVHAVVLEADTLAQVDDEGATAQVPLRGRRGGWRGDERSASRRWTEPKEAPQAEQAPRTKAWARGAQRWPHPVRRARLRPRGEATSGHPRPAARRAGHPRDCPPSRSRAARPRGWRGLGGLGVARLVGFGGIRGGRAGGREAGACAVG